MNKLMTVIAMLMLAGLAQASEMTVTTTTQTKIPVVDMVPIMFSVQFKDGVPARYIVQAGGIDSNGAIIARGTAVFTPEQAAMIIPSIVTVMPEAVTAVHNNKDLIIPNLK